MSFTQDIGIGQAAERPSIQQAFSRVLASIKQLPSPPEICLAVTRATQDEYTSLEDMQRLVENDIALSARLIQIANSAFFALREQVSSVRRAISLLGFSTVRTLALGFFFSEEFGKLRLEGLPYPDLPRFALATSTLAEAITADTNPPIRHEAACLGLLHEAGVIVMAISFGSRYRRLIGKLPESCMSLSELETDTCGLDHAAAGKLLMTGWRFSEPFVQAVGYHHQPNLPESSDTHAAELWKALQVAHSTALLFFRSDATTVEHAVRAAKAAYGWNAAALGRLLISNVAAYRQRISVLDLPSQSVAHDCEHATGVGFRLLESEQHADEAQ